MLERGEQHPGGAAGVGVPAGELRGAGLAHPGVGMQQYHPVRFEGPVHGQQRSSRPTNPTSGRPGTPISVCCGPARSGPGRSTWLAEGGEQQRGGLVDDRHHPVLQRPRSNAIARSGPRPVPARRGTASPNGARSAAPRTARRRTGPRSRPRRCTASPPPRAPRRPPPPAPATRTPAPARAHPPPRSPYPVGASACALRHAFSTSTGTPVSASTPPTPGHPPTADAPGSSGFSNNRYPCDPGRGGDTSIPPPAQPPARTLPGRGRRFFV